LNYLKTFKVLGVSSNQRKETNKLESLKRKNVEPIMNNLLIKRVKKTTSSTRSTNEKHKNMYNKEATFNICKQ